MKEFSLEEYLKNPDREVMTRYGRKVRIVCTDFDNPDYPVIGEIKGHKWPISFATNGEAIKGRKLSCDLFFAPEKHEGWINVYRNGEHLWCGDIKRTETEAKEFEDSEFYITTIKIEWEEDEA